MIRSWRSSTSAASTVTAFSRPLLSRNLRQPCDRRGASAAPPNAVKSANSPPPPPPAAQMCSGCPWRVLRAHKSLFSLSPLFVPTLLFLALPPSFTPLSMPRAAPTRWRRKHQGILQSRAAKHPDANAQTHAHAPRLAPKTPGVPRRGER